MTAKNCINRIKTFALALVMFASFVPCITASASEKAGDLTYNSITISDTDGDGVYEIGSHSELTAFAGIVNNGNTSINAKLTADIDCSGASVIAIGNFSWCKYNGTFNGNGKTISGISVTNGLFRYVGGTVQNLTVKDATVTTANLEAGGIVGILSGGTVENCKFVGGTVTKSVDGDDEQRAVGGIVGFMENSGIVRNCENSGTITSKSGFVAGIVGTVYGKTAQCQIIDCKNSGNIINNTPTANHIAAGGIVGYSYGSYGALVSKCYNTGNITGVRGSGGIAGVGINTIVSLCGNMGKVENSEGNAGGLCGYLQRNSKMENCYNIGNVSAEFNAGGVVGQMYTQNASEPALVTGCYSSCSVKVTGSDGGEGGLAGAVYANNTLKDCIYDNTKYTGNACGTVKGSVSGNQGASTEKFKSGEVCYTLNSRLTANNEKAVWGQYIGAYDTPIFDSIEVLRDDNGNYYNNITEFLILKDSESDGKAVASVAIPTKGTYKLIFAHYEGKELKNVDVVEITTQEDKKVITKSSNKEITLGKGDKIMLWSGDCTPKCNVYVVE